MAFRTYLQRNVKTGKSITKPFTKAHFINAGLHPGILGGMATLEAYQTINRWNSNSKTFVYTLPSVAVRGIAAV